MPKPVRVDAEAEAEIAAAIEWYEGERAGLGAELFVAIGDAVRSLAEPGPECTPARGVSPKLAYGASSSTASRTRLSSSS